MFLLDSRLETDTDAVTGLSLCQVRLMNDSRFPWLVLVPARPGLAELHDLDAAERACLVEEIAHASRVLEFLHTPDKINVGALGNIVRQLHVHVVARRADDAAWLGPVWGHGSAIPYTSDALLTARDDLRAAFSADPL